MLKYLLKLVKLYRIQKVFQKCTRVNRSFHHAANGFNLFMKKRNLHVPVGSETMIQIAVLVGICAHWLGCLNFMCTRLRNFPSESWLVKFELNEKNLVTQWRCAVLRSIVHLTELLSVEPTP